MADKEHDEHRRTEWMAEERWHLENATVDLNRMMRPLAPEQRIPDAQIFTPEGEAIALADHWRSKHLLLVLGSLSCPPSRLYNVELNALARLFADHLNVCVLYVIDAHPDGSVCPYTGTDWLTKDNEHDGIRVRQPSSQTERNALAIEYRDYLGLEVPVLVDNMANQAWASLGCWPNLAVLIDVKGQVVLAQEWSNPAELQQQLAAKWLR